MPVPTEVPDFSGYGLLGAILVIVFLFLVALSGIVWVFVRDRRDRDKAGAVMAEACHQVQRETLDVLKANGEFLGQNKEALNTNSLMLRDVNKTLVRMNGRD